MRQIWQMLKAWRASNFRMNLLQPDFKYDLRVMVTYENELKIFVPRFQTPEEVMRVCEFLVNAAHIVSVSNGLRMHVGAKGD